jgi:RNA polymerase sigma-70 factor (ECF subfamily)
MREPIEKIDADWDWFLRAKNGDENAWRALIDTHQSRLAALALFITGSAAAAEDVVQETFVRALGARIRNYAGSVQGYLGTIAYRLAVRESKRTQKNVALDGIVITDPGVNPIERMLTDERDKMVAEAIGNLAVDHRDILVLRFYGGKSYTEIAELMQIPIGTVKSRLFYAVKSCRDELRSKGVLK